MVVYQEIFIDGLAAEYTKTQNVSGRNLRFSEDFESVLKL